MKKMILFFSIVSLIILTCSFAFASHYYTKEMKVINVNNGTVALIDNNFNIWEWEEKGDENFIKDSIFKVKMFDNNTEESIFDDEIVSFQEVIR